MENKSVVLKIPQTQRFTELGTVPENISRNEDENLLERKDYGKQGNKMHIQEENFGIEGNFK